ncbi:MAG: Ig-like domain-containing protein, partial [Opitutales bacterium]
MFLLWAVSMTGAVQAQDWRGLNGGPARTAHWPATFMPAESLGLWERTFEEAFLSPVAVVDNRVFVVVARPEGGEVLALDAMSGQALWNHPLGEPLSPATSPTVHDGVVYLTAEAAQGGSQVLALRAADGERLWTAPYGGTETGHDGPAMDASRVWVGSERDGTLAGYNRANGSREVEVEVPATEGWSPTAFEGAVYSWTAGRLREHLPSDGSLAREAVTLDTLLPGRVAIADGAAVVGGLLRLRVFDLATMTERWAARHAFRSHAAIAGGAVYVPLEDAVEARDLLTGELQQTFTPRGRLEGSRLIVTDDALLVPTSEGLEVFARTSGAPLFTLGAVGEPSLADRVLIVRGAGSLRAWALVSPGGEGYFPPIARDDTLAVLTDGELEVEGLAAGTGLLANDGSLAGRPLTAEVVRGPAEGTLTLGADGSLRYVPRSGFEGVDTFRYRVWDGERWSQPGTVSIRVGGAEGAFIEIALTQDGQPVRPGQVVSGTLEGRLRVFFGDGMHAQLYQNFRPVETHERGGMVTGAEWVRTFTIDTREFFDGENLLSVHLHPHAEAGQAYAVNFQVETFLLETSNDHPAPGGDVALPTLATESPNLFFTPSTTFAGAQRLSVGELTFADDGETIQITGGEETRDGIQVIAHLGNSVLGRFRWAERSFPFGDNHLFEQVEMRPFQTAVARSAEVVLFFSDRVGRANYARLEVEVPALAADAGPPPRLDAQLLRPTQGDTVVVGADGHTVNVQVTGARAPEAADYDTLFLWVGNRLVDQVDLRPHFAALAGEEETFPVEMTIPQELIRSMQDPRVGGPDAAAFALWLDFSTGLNTDLNLPTSEHVLLTGVRTVDLPWPYGPPTVQLLGGGPLEFVRQGRFHAHAEGPLPDGYRIFHAVDGGTPTELAAPGEAFATEVLPRGEHVLEFYLTDAAGNLLTAQDPTVRFPFLVVNGPPVPALDGYATRPDEPLVVTAAEGVAQNDDDPEGDALAVSLVHGPEDGTLTLRGDGSFEYAPAAGFIGIDSFTYADEDGLGGTAQGRVLIDVRDQTPVAAPADWSQLGNGPGHQGVVQRHTAAAPLTPLWRRTLDVEGIER